MVYKVLWRNMLPIQPGTLGRTPSLCTGFFYMRLHNTWDQRLYVPSEGWSNGYVSCLRSQVSRGFEPTLCWSETPEFEFGALDHSATTLPKIRDILKLVHAELGKVGTSAYRPLSMKKIRPNFMTLLTFSNQHLRKQGIPHLQYVKGISQVSGEIGWCACVLHITSRAEIQRMPCKGRMVIESAEFGGKQSNEIGSLIWLTFMSLTEKNLLWALRSSSTLLAWYRLVIVFSCNGSFLALQKNIEYIIHVIIIIIIIIVVFVSRQINLYRCSRRSRDNVNTTIHVHIQWMLNKQ